jgi:hypothetical protein
VATLLELRTRCKSESDNVGQAFVADSEWNAFIASSYLDLYGQIVQAFGNDYFAQTPASGYTFTTDGTNQFFALPTDFFKLLGVDVQVMSGNNSWVSLKAFAFQDRNRYSAFNSQIPMAGQTVRVFYVPRATVPTADVDTIDGVNGWEEFIIIDACIKALAKEESDVSVFGARREQMEQRLASEIARRDASGSPARIVDVWGTKALGMQYRLNGNNLWLIGGNQGLGWPYGDWGAPDFGGWG